jgi:hypothetical protein
MPKTPPEKLAAALRANLKRRKQMIPPAPPPDPSKDPEKTKEKAQNPAARSIKGT